MQSGDLGAVDRRTALWRRGEGVQVRITVTACIARLLTSQICSAACAAIVRTPFGRQVG